MDSKTQLLARVPLFSELDASGLAQVAKPADGGRRTATARAETPVRVLVLGRREFNTLVGEFPDIRAAVLEALAKRVRRLDSTAD